MSKKSEQVTFSLFCTPVDMMRSVLEFDKLTDVSAKLLSYAKNNSLQLDDMGQHVQFAMFELLNIKTLLFLKDILLEL